MDYCRDRPTASRSRLITGAKLRKTKNPLRHRVPGPYLPAAVHVVAGNACDPTAGEDQGPDVVVRDSAGLEIVENHARVEAAEFRTVDLYLRVAI